MDPQLHLEIWAPVGERPLVVAALQELVREAMR